MSEHVVDLDTSNFESEAVARSQELPVVVDFWAKWCGPCKTLGPTLEQLAEEYQGQFLLARVDVEQNPELAAQYQVQGIPAVKALVEGQVADEFTGTLPEQQIRQFIDRILPSEAQRIVAQAREMKDQGRLEKADSLLDQALETDPNYAPAKLVQAEIRLAQQRLEEAKELLSRLPVKYEGEPEVTALKARLRFAQVAAEIASEEEATRSLEADPADLTARYQLAAYRVLAGDYQSAFEHLLEIVRQDRNFREDAGRQGMLALFDLLGNQDRLVSEYRTKLSRALF